MSKNQSLDFQRKVKLFLHRPPPVSSGITTYFHLCHDDHDVVKHSYGYIAVAIWCFFGWLQNGFKRFWGTVNGVKNPKLFKTIKNGFKTVLPAHWGAPKRF